MYILFLLKQKSELTEAHEPLPAADVFNHIFLIRLTNNHELFWVLIFLHDFNTVSLMSY